MSFILRDIANWYLMAKNPVQRSGVRSCQWLYMACFGIWHCSFRFNTLRPEGLVCWSYCCYCCLSTWDKPSKFEPARDALRIQIRNKRSKSSTAIRRVTSTHIVPPDRRPGCGKKQRRLHVWTDGPLIHPVVRDYFIVFINARKYANFILWRHMPRQVLCKASSRRSGLCDAIGGAGTLPSGPLTPILQLTFHSLGQHVTGALRGETHSHVTYFCCSTQ